MNVGPLIDYLVQFHNRWVPEIGQCVYFAVDGLLGLRICQILLIVSLDRDYMLRLLVNGSAHNSEGALPDLESNHEFL